VIRYGTAADIRRNVARLDELDDAELGWTVRQIRDAQSSIEALSLLSHEEANGLAGRVFRKRSGPKLTLKSRPDMVRALAAFERDLLRLPRGMARAMHQAVTAARRRASRVALATAGRHARGRYRLPAKEATRIAVGAAVRFVEQWDRRRLTSQGRAALEAAAERLAKAIDLQKAKPPSALAVRRALRKLS
jgi:hypothetical protein